MVHMRVKISNTIFVFLSLRINSRIIIKKAGNSIISHPILDLIVGPQPFLIYRPYGAVTTNRVAKTIDAAIKTVIRKIL